MQYLNAFWTAIEPDLIAPPSAFTPFLFVSVAMISYCIAGGLIFLRRFRTSGFLGTPLLLLALFFLIYGTGHLLTLLDPTALSSFLPMTHWLKAIILAGFVVACIAAIPQFVEIAESQRLKEVQTKYRSIFENAVEGIIQTTQAGRFIAVNPAFARMLGYDSPEQIVREVTDIGEQVYCNREDRYRFRRVVEEDSVARMEIEAKRRDGARVWLSVSARAVRDEAGALLYFESIVEDVTEKFRATNALRLGQELLRRSEERYRSLVAATASVVWLADPGGAFRTPQSSWEFYTGQVWPQHDGFGWLEMFHPDDREAIEGAYRKAISEGSVFRSEGRLWSRERSAYRFFEASAVALRNDDDSVREWVGIVTDVDDRKRMEADLNQYRFERKGVEESLRQHAEELARSNRELEQFVYISSHDLKEPLRMVSLYAELLQRHLGASLDARGKDYLRYLVTGAQRMQELINDLLSYSRVGRELSPFAEVDCNRAVSAALENLKAAIAESGAQVNVVALPTIFGNEGQMTQLFQNLIGNAIKFRSDHPPQVVISADLVGEDLVFSLQDNGIGIDSRYRDRIFTLFQRLHTPQKYPGTGIGLSICKRIVEHHGGKIWVESRIGSGSIFHFSFPSGIRSQASEKGVLGDEREKYHRDVAN